ncbi:MAG: phage/plasmid primase, P4 family [Vicinamibacterales bacterium]
MPPHAPPGPTPGPLNIDEIFGGLSRPMPAAVKAVRQVMNGETPDDILGDTDAALAAAFAVAHSERLRYDFRRQAWMLCDATTGIWRQDESGDTRQALQAWAEQRAFDAVIAAASKRDAEAVRASVRRSLAARGLHNLLDLATYQRPVAYHGKGWDPDPWVLATAGGQLVDLKTGGIRATQPADLITRACAVPIDTAARCDRWRQFVHEIADGDPELVELIRRALGYSITGDVGEQVFFVAIGNGANGKSTLLELVAHVLGDLAGVLPFGTLARDRDARAVQAEVAELPGTRFVRSSEIREGAYVDEGRLKSFTGGDPISASRKYAHPFVFKPAFKLWLGLNHRPRVSDRSHGFWRRAVLIPFTRTFAGDTTLEARLRDEAPGILAWLVEAALDWQREGLPRPAASEAARDDWRQSQDLIGQWASGALVADPEGRLPAAEAYKAFCAWAVEEGLSDRERAGARTFGEWMTSQFGRHRTKAGMVYGCRVKGSVGSPLNSSPTRARGESLSRTLHHPSPYTHTDPVGGGCAGSSAETCGGNGPGNAPGSAAGHGGQDFPGNPSQPPPDANKGGPGRV